MKRLNRSTNGRSLTLDELLEWINADHPSDRRFAASKLGDYSGSRVTKTLIQALSDPNPDVRSAAADSLGRLGSESIETSLARQVVQRLVFLLEDEYEEVIGSAIYALGKLGDSSVGAKLVPFLNCPNTTRVKMRNIVIQALRALRYKPAIPCFFDLIRDPDPTVRNDALFALFSLRHTDTSIKQTFKSLVDDHDPLVRERVQGMLEIMTKKGELGE
jgi:HEAT repeat protein